MSHAHMIRSFFPLLFSSFALFLLNSCVSTHHQRVDQTTHSNWRLVDWANNNSVYSRVKANKSGLIWKEVDDLTGEVYSQGDTNGVSITHALELKNFGAKRISLVGLVTYSPVAEFVDLNQPGAIQISLYPGQEATARTLFGGDRLEQPVYLRIADMVEH